MFGIGRAVFAVACVFAVLPSANAQGAPSSVAPPNRPGVELFGQLPSISEPQLSPDGKHLAAVRAYKGRPAAWVYDLAAPAGTSPIVIPYQDGYIEGVQWAKNNRLLFTVNINAQRGVNQKIYAFLRTIAVDPQGQNPVELLSNAGLKDDMGSTSDIADLDLDDPDHIFMPLVTEGGSYGLAWDMFITDVNTGHGKSVVSGGNRTAEFIMDGHGKVVGRVDEDEYPIVDHLLLNDGQGWKEIAKYDATGGHGGKISGLTDDGHAFVRYAEGDFTDTTGLMQVSLADGKENVLFFDMKYDIDRTLRDPWTDRVIGAAYADDQHQYRYFDKDKQALQNELQESFPGTSVHAISWDTAEDTLVVAVASPRLPVVYYLWDRSKHKKTLIGNAYPGLKNSDLGDLKAYPYKARDGLNIPAYVTMPPGKPGKNLPTVIMPHGGPWARDTMGFDWMAQFLANRGYVVLQPNYRGSYGFGTKFMEAGFGQWGLKMQDDITDGVKKLIADGIADPKRICIFGWSYGGYAALAGATFTPDLYACAISGAGISDLPEHLSTASEKSGYNSWEMSALNRYIGDRYHDFEKLDAASPAEHADRIECPVLLFHGEADTTVRIKQSEIMQRAMERAGKHVEFVRLPRETHYMETAETRIRVLTEVEKFLQANIGN